MIHIPADYLTSYVSIHVTIDHLYSLYRPLIKTQYNNSENQASGGVLYIHGLLPPPTLRPCHVVS
jgi:hypothetical protein